MFDKERAELKQALDELESAKARYKQSHNETMKMIEALKNSRKKLEDDAEKKKEV